MQGGDLSMREIKFRAWHRGIPKRIRHSGFPAQMFYDEWSGEVLGFMHQKQDIEAVMQFTGLKDKNGKDIYEGDILTFTEWSWSRKLGNVSKDTFVKVVWSHAGFILEGSKFEWNFEKGEIVGNIYQNPELVK